MIDLFNEQYYDLFEFKIILRKFLDLNAENMKKIIALSFVLLTMLSCKNKNSKTENNPIAVQEMIDSTATGLSLGCYVFHDNNNHVSLEFTEIGPINKGNLTYNFAEKDKNTGTFIGHLKDGILLADYTFQSEGLETVRQVAFKVNNDTLIEGYGDMNAEGTTFKDVRALKFTSTMPLIKADCTDEKDACLFEEGKSYSELEQKCLTLSTLKTTLNPLKDGAKTEGKQAYVLFNEDHSKAEVFLPKFNKGIVLKKSGEGNWVSGNYTLIAWKGYVLQEKSVAIYGG